MKKSRITRIMRILTALQSGRRYKVDDLAEMLDLSRRTVFRDLKELFAVGICYHYDAKNTTYVIDKDCLLTPPDLTLQEALGLLMVLRKAANHIPELRPLDGKTVAVVGLGTLGAPSVLEFARAGVGCIRMIDHDIVDPSTTVRWPLGFTAAGHKKVVVLKNFIERNYPYTQCEVFDFRIGATREANSIKPPDQEVIANIFAGADVIYDCTAELGVQHFLTDWAWNEGLLYVGVSGTLGGWGGLLMYGRDFIIRINSGVGNSLLKNVNYMFLDKHCLNGRLGHGTQCPYYRKTNWSFLDV